MIIVNGFQPLTIITKSSTLDVAAVLDPPLRAVTLFFQGPMRYFKNPLVKYVFVLIFLLFLLLKFEEVEVCDIKTT